jgi:heme/copper-type cytochrome/quinol oxidase subunit 2
MSYKINKNSEDLISNIDIKDNSLVSKKWKIKVIIGILFLAIIGLNVSMENVRQMNGSIASKDEIIRSLILTLFIYIPIFGFVIGTLTSLIPYNNAEYSKKYFPISLLTILGFEALVILMRIAFW